MQALRVLLPVFLGLLQCAGATVSNAGFESGSGGWRVWSRDRGAATLQVSSEFHHTGKNSGHLKHTGTQDWSLEPELRVAAKPGEFFELSVWIRTEGEGTAKLCAATWDAAGKALDWSYGERTSNEAGAWHQLRSRLLVPEGVAQLQPRLIGYGAVSVLVDDFEFRRSDSASVRRDPMLPPTLSITNELLVLTLETTNATLTVTDRRIGRVYRQRSETQGILLRSATASSGRIEMDLFDGASGLDLKASAELVDAKPEFTFELQAAGELASALRFPHPFDTQPGEWLVIPMNEGISYPVEDQGVPLHRLIAYGGHGICMAFWGVTDGQRGHMGIIESPDDAAIRMGRSEGRMFIAPEWDPQRQTFGCSRKLRFVFFDKGGHVAMAKRYRAHAKAGGLLKTLSEKRQFNPNVDMLIGAVNVWCWDREPEPIVNEMQAAGIERILWSNRQPPEKLRALNARGVLTSRYDIYQDVMDPEQFPKLRGVHQDWTTSAWPKDIMIASNRQWVKGWGVTAKDGSIIPCGVLCDKQALSYARERTPAELETHPYKCRFIDTTTASPWRECYHPDHPMTRTESREYKMKLLEYFSKDLKLVTGCETGHDASVPYLHYFEGMLSLGPFRVPDSGRRMQTIWTNVPDQVARFQLGHNYRLPLWELVFHDCVVSQWYWGDYNNKLPALWDKRDLFNLLYGTPPMFMFERKFWAENKERFVQSYKNICPHVRELGYAEMTDHRFLTPDRTVQQTEFSSGHRITVNFGVEPHRLPDGTEVKSNGFVVKRN